jgi:hypothetical protein
MRRMHRIVLLVALVALAPVLVGCENFDNEKFDIFGLNDKKKLKGERKEVFPQGVPGVTQGLPPEYLNKQSQPDTAQTPAALPANAAAGASDDKAAAPAPPSKTAAVEPVQEPKPKAKPKRKPKPRTATRPATQVAAPPAPQRQNGGQQQPAPWPDQNQAQSPPPAQGQSTSTAPWPSAPPPGTFSR